MYKIRLTITGASDMKKVPGHMIVIVCMSVYYYLETGLKEKKNRTFSNAFIKEFTFTVWQE